MIDNPFWSFSLALYAKEGVADACLLLQDKLGYDVNLLLLACWTGGCRGIAITESDWRGLIKSTGLWREEIVGPLRQVRRTLKSARWNADWGHCDHLRRKVLDIELECERAEQDFLLSRVATNFETGDASGNVDTLATAMGVDLDASDRSGLDCILSAAADFAS
jgi:uncharacterized protein (TIGR02444 family)